MDIRDSPVKVKRIDTIRLDESNKTYYTKEGYLIDHPILTSCGIFEYTNEDGSIRRELRLPEYVFDPESLASYKGKPIIVTHDAGTVDKNNVSRYEVGTILSDGIEDGNDVRAEIVIHDTDAMESAGLKELSLGYNLDLIEQAGEYEGQHYDAIQTNIRVNHLALVRTARAGEQARLNIDSSDEPVLKGGKVMAKRYDEGLSPDELKAAIEEYKAKKAAGGGAPASKPSPQPTQMATPKPSPAPVGNPAANIPSKVAEPMKTKDGDLEDGGGQTEMDEGDMGLKEVLADIKANAKARAIGEDAPSAEDDIANLLDAIGGSDGNTDEGDEPPVPMQEDGDDGAMQPPDAPINEDCDDKPDNEDEDEVPDNEDEDDTPDNEDEDDQSQSNANSSGTKPMNMDSIDRIVSQKLNICKIGERLNLHGLEKLSIRNGKKTIVKKVMPHLRLDGKSDEYINACYDFAVGEIKSRKNADYQRSQMTKKDSKKRYDSSDNVSMAEAARERMISRDEGGND